ncbi:LOW QUALITY PROTEIN: hypothetical protein PanWU01x14_113110 [Parasponia andersonii]|uniref:Uncharacterized protein n=1 Tax=Parasponia andersonii TaxID=3476 RepID=A0A2P5CXP3_PARAD|nr:LOW QUALITY PROTEIN: hypothetical protein PanWU01x14_113110 [Parasponia andersonii]
MWFSSVTERKLEELRKTTPFRYEKVMILSPFDQSQSVQLLSCTGQVVRSGLRCHFDQNVWALKALAGLWAWRVIF